MAIAGVGSTLGFVRSFDPAQRTKQIAKKIIRDFDSDNDGSLSKTEYTEGLKSKGVSDEDALKMFNAIDINGTGKITQADLEASIQRTNALRRRNISESSDSSQAKTETQVNPPTNVPQNTSNNPLTANQYNQYGNATRSFNEMLSTFNLSV